MGSYPSSNIELVIKCNTTNEKFDHRPDLGKGKTYIRSSHLQRFLVEYEYKCPKLILRDNISSF